MEISREYINPKYYADFQRRFRKDIQKKTKSSSVKNKTENGYHVFESTTNDQTTTIQINDTLENSKFCVTRCRRKEFRMMYRVVSRGSSIIHQ
jgi:hypothetical protein